METIARNYLEIKSLNQLSEIKKPGDNYSLNQVIPNDFQLNKFFYKQIGKNHQWLDRLTWTDKNWIEYVSNHNLFTFVLKKMGVCGLLVATIIYLELVQQFRIWVFGY